MEESTLKAVERLINEAIEALVGNSDPKLDPLTAAELKCHERLCNALQVIACSATFKASPAACYLRARRTDSILFRTFLTYNKITRFNVNEEESEYHGTRVALISMVDKFYLGDETLKQAIAY